MAAIATVAGVGGIWAFMPLLLPAAAAEEEEEEDGTDDAEAAGITTAEVDDEEEDDDDEISKLSVPFSMCFVIFEKFGGGGRCLPGGSVGCVCSWNCLPKL